MSGKAPTILITGASGFVGAHLCLYFAAKGYPVVALTGTQKSTSLPWRLAYVESQAQREFFSTAQADLTRPTDIKKLFQEKNPGVIINCAAYGAYASQADQDRIYSVNFDAVRTLLECARELTGLQAFIQMGSSSEYGTNCTAPLEDAPTLPDSHYAVSKAAATQLVQFYGTKHALPAWTFRLYSVYGPLEDASRLIPKALLASLEGKLPPLVNPKISRDFIYVDDVCEAVENLLAKSPSLQKGQLYNIGSGTKTRLEDLVNTLRSSLGVKETPNWGSMGDRAWDHADWYSNPERARSALGWTARTDLANGLKTMQNWLKAHPDLVKKSIEHSIVASKPN